MAENSKPELCSRVWLLKGPTGSAPGTLELANGQLSFTLTDSGALWGPQLRDLEEKAKQPGLASAIENGETSQVFCVRVEDIEVNFPWYNFNGGAVITVDTASYRFSFLQPQNTKMPEPRPEQLSEAAEKLIEGGSEILDGVNTGKSWKAALSKP